MYTYVIIDDEAIIRKGLISRISSITSEEYRCVGEAANGIQGLSLIKENKPDIIITDMKMGRMGGEELLQRLSSVAPDIPVIVISGYKNFDYVKTAIEKNAVGYLLKPFSV